MGEVIWASFFPNIQPKQAGMHSKWFNHFAVGVRGKLRGNQSNFTALNLAQIPLGTEESSSFERSTAMYD